MRCADVHETLSFFSDKTVYGFINMVHCLVSTGVRTTGAILAGGYCSLLCFYLILCYKKYDSFQSSQRYRVEVFKGGP